MRLLPWDYGVRNLLRRPMRTLLTAVGLALVVFLLLLVVAFQRGLELSLQQSGEADVLLLHNMNAAENIENSSISDEVAVLARTEFANQILQVGGVPALSPELTIASRVEAQTTGNSLPMAVLRGVDFQRVFLVRGQVHLREGKLPEREEILVGRLAAAKLGLPPETLTPGRVLRIEGKSWKISGRFAAPGTLLESEIWCGLDDLKHQMKRPNDVSLVAMKCAPGGNPKQQLGYVEYFCRNRRPDLELMASRESDYYAALQKHYGPMRALTWLLVLLVGAAGACGAINTMYAAVAGRVREFAALQAIGFSRRAILISLFQESLLLAALATLLATGGALLLLHGVAIRFSMSAFTLPLDETTLLIGCAAGLLLGIVGAVPPAARTLRMSILDALKAV